MSEDVAKKIHTLPPDQAAEWLGIDENSVRALVQARYLDVINGEIPMVEVRAFQARNAESGAGFDAAQQVGFEELVDMLADRADELAHQAYDLFLRATPQARNWGIEQREAFIEQAAGRFDAVLAVASHGAEVDQALQEDLYEVGANAAWAGSSLPHLLLVLRISRDLLMQNSMQIASDGGGRWDKILASFFSALFPSIDRLTDAISTGYWRALLSKVQEEHERLAFLIENSPYGVYEADIDGLVQYANPALAAMVGRPGDVLTDLPLSEVFKPTEGSVSQLLAEPSSSVGHVTLTVPTAAGESTLEIDTVLRRIDNDVIGFAGILRMATAEGVAAPDLSGLVRHIFELRRSVEILAEAGGFLTNRSHVMTPEQMHLAGESVRLQAKRLVTVIDELDAERKSL